MIGIRQKLMLAFGGLIAVVTAIGTMTLSQIDSLGLAIDVILKENYRSVVACQDMKEALERIDSGLLFTLAGNQAQGTRLIGEYTPRFRAALDVELGNITLAGERDRAERIRTLFADYTRAIPAVTASPLRDAAALQAGYFSKLQPLFQDIKKTAQEILIMNQANMSEANDAARRRAQTAHRRMLMAILIAANLALLFSYLTHRSILHPINRLIESTDEIRRGNLDLVLESDSSDEIGRLSESFNEMAAAFRQVRKEDRISLLRTRQATEEVFKALPAAIAVLDLDGRVEVSTEMADRQFGLKPGVLAVNLGYDWLPPLIRKALDGDRAAVRDSRPGYVQHFVGNREYFFQPMAVPIPAGPGQEPTGVALILEDVTRLHEQQELKRGVVSTVSHQLKTPLTSLRMSLHLLLEERIGALNDKQTELLVTARDDSERLVGILDDLLDLNRIESGKARVDPRPAAPQALVRDAVEPFLVEARDKGITLTNAVPDDLPEVMADPEKIRHVFSNLLSNALRFTSPGGAVTVRADREQDRLAFVIEDTGKGIPAEYLGRLFEPFYRVPGQDEKSGVGLGLAIVKEIVQAHGGEVRAASEIGKGSVFRFTLPLKPGPGAVSCAPSIEE